MNLFLTVAILLALVVAVGFLWRRQTTFLNDTVTIDGNIVVRVEVAATPSTRERGLSGHRPLADDEGMLFVFDHAERYAFWMKDMLFSIDIIWIKDGLVADITTDVPTPIADQPLPSFAPRVPVDRVLEVPAGFSAKHGLRIGSTVEGTFTPSP